MDYWSYKKYEGGSTTVARRTINRIIEEFGKEVRGKVLFVGVYPQRDYSIYFDEFVTLDIKKEFCPNIVGDIQHCPQIPDKHFDGVIMSGLYEYLSDHKKAIAEIYRILKDGGKFLLCAAGYGLYNNRPVLEPKESFDLLKPFLVEKMEITYYKNENPFYIHITAKKI